MPAHVRKGDLVMVIAGEGRSEKRTGKVLRVIPDRQMVVVEGINVHKKHVRPSQQNPRGGMMEKEMPIHISNVLPVVDGKPTRVRFENRPVGSKVRFAVVNGQPFGPALNYAEEGEPLKVSRQGLRDNRLRTIQARLDSSARRKRNKRGEAATPGVRTTFSPNLERP